jgi:hypothetical protein
MDSDKIKAILQDFRVIIPLGVVVGLILGLVIGWGIWPVQWTDAAAEHLRADVREDYLRMAIYTTIITSNDDLATKAWSELGETAEETLAGVRNDPAYLTPEQITIFEAIVGAEVVEATPPAEETATLEEDEGQGVNWLLLGGLCVVLLLVAGVVFYFLVLRDRLGGGEEPETLASRGAAPHEGEWFKEEQERFASDHHDDLQTPEGDPQSMPVAQFMTTYMVGDDLYDDSFSIDAPTGEFLGECGVGISETVGVGEPKRVTAFEIWLFDKNDIQTVTKVVMSEHAYEDEKIRVRLESKGEPVLMETGKQVLLETAKLQLEARIVDMEYGEGSAPDRSFFERLTLELSVWPK